MRRIAWVAVLGCGLAMTWSADAASPRASKESRAETLFAVDNLVAWCIVPFDAMKRGPAERAEMVKRLGLTKVAYDWRAEHVPTFEDEILQYRKHGLEMFAFWSWHDSMAPLIEKYGIRPQIWKTVPSPAAGSQAEKVEAAAAQLAPLAKQAAALSCKFGLYNHGGWGGEPENMKAVADRLRELTGSDQIGIVYNLHHGHDHIDDFAEVLDLLMPDLLCLNLNGMATGGEPKILPLGQGEHDREILRAILDSGYTGPVGILGHRADTDAEESLRQNLEGLHGLVETIE